MHPLVASTIAVRNVSFFKTKWFTTSARYLQGKFIRFGPLSALIIWKDVLLNEIGYSKPFLWVNINIAEGVPLRSSWHMVKVIGGSTGGTT